MWIEEQHARGPALKAREELAAQRIQQKDEELRRRKLREQQTDERSVQEQLSREENQGEVGDCSACSDDKSNSNAEINTQNMRQNAFFS